MLVVDYSLKIDFIDGGSSDAGRQIAIRRA